MTELELLEREATLQPSPTPRDTWWAIEARRDELRRDWLPTQTRQPRCPVTGRYLKEDPR